MTGLPVFFLQETADGSRFWDNRLHPGNVLLEVARQIPYQRQADDRPKRVSDWL